MAQQTFSGAGPGDPADLDANFTELYSKAAWSTTGIGYATGAGGTVTQLTSKATGVTLNKLSGRVTMHNESLAAGASAVVQVTNSAVTQADVVAVSTVDDFGASYVVAAISVWDGYFYVRLTNITGSPLAQAVRFSFVVIRAATS